jgi:hypothetical protein
MDHASKPAEKIRISGGGRCNFTNLHCTPQNFLSQNPRFCVSALKRYTQHDFIWPRRKTPHRLARENPSANSSVTTARNRSSACFWIRVFGGRRAASARNIGFKE